MRQDAIMPAALHTLVTAAIPKTVALNKLLGNFGDTGHSKFQISFQSGRKIRESESTK